MLPPSGDQGCRKVALSNQRRHPAPVDRPRHPDVCRERTVGSWFAEALPEYFLRTHNIMIECGAASVSIEPDREKSIITSSPANTPELEARIPRQRIQHQKQKRGIV
jgi:hypothetical protein